MTKRFLLIPAIALFFGGIIALTSHKAMSVKAEEEIVEVEENTKYKELLEKINEIRNSQVVTAIVAVLSGSAGGFLLSIGPMLVNRETIKKAETITRLASSQLVATADAMKVVKETNDIHNAKYDKGIEVVEKAAEKTQEVSEKLDVIEKNQEVMAQQHKEDVELLLSIIGSSKELVANGTAEKLNKHFGK